ncbi:unnamed protein product [Calypogeia fissa]
MAKCHYAACKHQSRERSCATTLPNLVKAYKLFRGCNEAEAVLQVLQDAEWIDTSDEEGPTKVQGQKGEESGEEDLHVIAVSKDVENSTDSLAPHQGIIDIEQCLGEEVDFVVPNVTNLDDLTPAQVVFGHGLYAGITLSREPPSPNPNVP